VRESAWDPSQYNRFAAEREQPFWDLFSQLEPVGRAQVVDLGCGDGRLTVALHERLGAERTTGVDNSPSMLAVAIQRNEDGVDFLDADIACWPEGAERVEIIFSNAALQWVSDHEGVLSRWRGALDPGGQLAVQVPANADHPSHEVLRALADELLGGSAPADPVAENVLPPARYAELLYGLGFARQQVDLRVYGHVLGSSSEVVEWMKGTSLNRFKAVMAAEEYAEFVAEYGRRLTRALGDGRPYFYPFKRILLWGRLAG
jgi:trans-aconitate 2-methyltransferase